MKRTLVCAFSLFALVALPLGASSLTPPKKPVVGVLLSGSGVFDGTELTEAVSTLVALDRSGAEVVAIAPDMEQREVIDHLTQKPSNEKRNVLVESARIVQGAVKNIASVTAKDLDALIVVGGYGAIKNLSSFAVDGANCTVQPEVERLLTEMLQAHKPIGSMCIASVVVAKVAGKLGLRPKLTIGTDEGIAAAIVAMGGEHVPSTVSDVVVDQKNGIASTPAFMLATRVTEVATGIDKLVSRVLMMVAARRLHPAN